MESSKSSSDDKNNHDQNLSEDESSDKSDKRQKLEKEIKALRETVKQLQQKLKTVRLNNIKTSTSNIKNTVADTNKETALKNINYEFYKYSGLYCARSTRSEYIIGFSSLRGRQKENLFAIEFVKRDNKLKIGKWVMPMSIDIKELLLEVPLKTIENIVPFVRNCKQHIDCYMIRLQQYQELKSSLDNLKNCNVQTNLGYTSFILELSHVYDKINESYAHITIYLCYNSKSNKPNEIKLEVNGNIQYDEETKKKLKKSLKVFYINDLIAAFDKIFKKDDKQFTWEKEKKDDDILEIDEYTSSEEDEISNKRWKRTISLRKNPKKIKKDNIDEKLKQRNENKKFSKQPSQQEVHTEASISKPKKIVHSPGPSETVKNKSKSTKSKSSKNNLSIQLRSRGKSKNSSKMIYNVKTKPLSHKLQKIKKNITSTPKRLNASGSIPFKELPALDISDIVNKENNE